MNEKLHTKYGDISLTKRGKFWHLYISFRDIPYHKIYRTSLNTPSLHRAKPLAIAKVEQEFSRRSVGIIGGGKISPTKYLTENHKDYLHSQIGKPLDTQKGGLMTAQKVKDDLQQLMKHFYPMSKEFTWDYLQTARFGSMFVDSLRDKGLSESTVAQVLGKLNRYFRQAIREGHMNAIPMYPALKRKSRKVRGMGLNSIAMATDEMIYELQEYLQKLVFETKHLGKKSSYIQQLAWFHIMADTGCRPYINPPMKWRDIELVNDDEVYLWRNEKEIQYESQGSKVTVEALDTLKQLYLSKGINVKSDLNLPVFIKFNGEHNNHLAEYFRERLYELDWHNKTDNRGRKFTSYSIRKWHINKAIIDKEDRHDLADRVGHDYQTLVDFYFDYDNRIRLKRTSNIWQDRNSIAERHFRTL